MTATDKKARLAELTAKIRPLPLESGLASYQNGTMSDGGKWIESPMQAGLRFVGFADELAPRRVQHFGWFDSEFQESVYRGAVYQLPASGGRVRLVPAVRHGSGGRRHSWSDDAGVDGAAILYLSDVTLSDETGGWSFDAEDFDSVRDCASLADQYAERLAEEAREYDEAWQAGSAAAAQLESAQTARAEFLLIAAEFKAERPERPALAYAIKCKLAELAEQWSDSKRDYFEALSNWSGTRLESAFREGSQT